MEHDNSMMGYQECWSLFCMSQPLIPEDNLSILQGLCPKGEPAIAGAESSDHETVFFLMTLQLKHRFWQIQHLLMVK